MSEIIVVVYEDQYRASEALNDLSRRDWDWAGDLERAVVVSQGENGKQKVLLSVELTAGEGVGWAKLWGSLLSFILLSPHVERVSEAANAVTTLSHGAATGTTAHTPAPGAEWWRSDFRISAEFVRDVGALIRPGNSGLFMWLRSASPVPTMRQLHNYGGMLLHTSLTPEQDGKLADLLAG